MFEFLKKVLGRGRPKEVTSTQLPSHASSGLVSTNRVSEWATMQGLAYSQRPDGRSGHHVQGHIGGKAWRMEQGKPSRDFIKGLELRARGELDVESDVSVMVLSRQLKNALEKQAFEHYTDSLQTIADTRLPEEMRWLSIYEEVGWESMGETFLNQYAVLSDNRDQAQAWLGQDLINLLVSWPSSDPAIPKILMLRRGKAYLRMQYTDGDIATLEHATHLFTTACELGLSAFKSKTT